MNSRDHCDFSGRCVVVTGAGRGLGRAIARRFGELGAKIAYLSRSRPPDVDDELIQLAGRARFLEVDVSEPEPVRKAFLEVATDFGPVDVLINNAGIAIAGGVEELEPADWDKVMANNVRSQFLCIRECLPGMRDRRYGKIVNISSVAGRDKSLFFGCSYTTSKAAVIGLTRHVASEAAGDGVNVNCVCPGPHRTPMLRSRLDPASEDNLRRQIPLGYIPEPEEIVDVVVFLASNAARYMTGAIVDVNGGLI